MKSPCHSKRLRLLPSIGLDLLWALVVLVGIFVFLSTHPIRPHDFWWHMAAGRELVETGDIPTVDTYSSTMRGTSYPAYTIYWLAETALYTVYTAGGPALSVFVHSLVVTSAYALTLWLCHLITRSWRIAALATLFAAALGINDWNVRPQALTFWFVPFQLLAIHAYRDRDGRWLLAAFPVTTALWVNCHGSFFIGLLLPALWLAEELWLLWAPASDTTHSRCRKNATGAATAFVSAALACLVNPSGLGIVSYVQDLTTNSVIQHLVPEWAPPTFSDLHGALFLVGLLTAATILALSPKRPGPFQMLSFLAFAALGLRTSRGGIWFGLALAPVLADHVSALVTRYSSQQDHVTNRGSRPLNVLFAALLLASAVLTLPWLKRYLPLPAPKAGLVSNETPISATEYLLANHLPGPIFNDVGSGSYLAWAAQPDYPVFVDPRIELYPANIWEDYVRISTAQPGWEEALARYDIQTLILSPDTQSNLIQAVRLSPAWTERYADSAAVVLTRQNPN